jgi:hypothetical protein
MSHMFFAAVLFVMTVVGFGKSENTTSTVAPDLAGNRLIQPSERTNAPQYLAAKPRPTTVAGVRG